MFLLISKRLPSSLMVMIIAVSLIWISNSSAGGLLTQVNDDLPQVALKAGSNLEEDGNQARKKHVPVLMFFSMQHCPFCNQVEEDFLKPMLRNSEYDSKVIIRKIKIDDSQLVLDFNGKGREAGKFSEEYKVSMVPTLILVDANGRKLSPSIIGIANAHYYSGELDDAIEASLQKIRSVAKR